MMTSAALPPIQLFASVASTNDLALAAVDEGAPHGACWVADQQSSGRGRREVGGQRRAWFSPSGANIYMSLLLRPTVEPSRAAGLTLSSAIAICEVLREMTGLDIWIKWPNDLYLADRKVAGILTEAVSTGSKLDAVITGVGINVNVKAEQVPEELEPIMTSLAIESGRPFDRVALVLALQRQMVSWADRFCEGGFDAVIDVFRDYDRTAGRRVTLVQNGDRVPATARGLGQTGELVVELDDGRTLEVNAGEVLFAPLSQER